MVGCGRAPRWRRGWATRLGRKVWPQRGRARLRKGLATAEGSRPRHAKAASPEEQAAQQKKLAAQVDKPREEEPGRQVEAGLPPAPARPEAGAASAVGPREDSGRSRSGGTATSGSTSTASSTRAPARWSGSCATPSTPCSSGAVLAAFAAAVGAGEDKLVVLVLDNAGWHVSGDLVRARRGSSWPSCRPTRPSCSRPSTSGRWRTRRSRTSTSPCSRTSTRR